MVFRLVCLLFGVAVWSLFALVFCFLVGVLYCVNSVGYLLFNVVCVIDYC